MVWNPYFYLQLVLHRANEIKCMDGVLVLEIKFTHCSIYVGGSLVGESVQKVGKEGRK